MKSKVDRGIMDHEKDHLASFNPTDRRDMAYDLNVSLREGKQGRKGTGRKKKVNTTLTFFFFFFLFLLVIDLI